MGIIFDKELVFTKSYGMRNLITQEKCDEYSNFRLASITKQFTATAILQLVSKKQLHLEDTLFSIFPEFHQFPDITIFHLLTHSSGLENYEDLL